MEEHAWKLAFSKALNTFSAHWSPVKHDDNNKASVTASLICIAFIFLVLTAVLVMELWEEKRLAKRQKALRKLHARLRDEIETQILNEQRFTSHQSDIMDDEQRKNLCAICFDRRANISLSQCHHVLCSSCLLRLARIAITSESDHDEFSFTALLKCPFCRCNINLSASHEQLHEAKVNEENNITERTPLLFHSHNN